MGRLVAFVARVASAGWPRGDNQTQGHGGVLGVGISEHTAVLVSTRPATVCRISAACMLSSTSLSSSTEVCPACCCVPMLMLAPVTVVGAVVMALWLALAQVEPSGEASFIGAGPAYFLRSKGRLPTTCTEGKPLSWRAPGVDVWRWNESDTKLACNFSFGAWESKTCGVSYTLTVQHGQLASSQPGGSVY